jgi:hypothetical protein
MKWFKHLSGSLNDNLIWEAVEEFGGDGYMVFFGILEMLADEFDPYEPGKCELSYKKMTKNLQLSRQKTVRILKFYDQKANENRSKNISFFVQFEKKHVVINCPKFKILTDNYTLQLLKDISKEDSKSLQSKLRKNFRIESDLEVEEESIKNKESADGHSGSNHYTKKLGGYLDEIKSYISQIEKLVQTSNWKYNVHAWVQVQVNESKHPKAISETLGGLIQYWDGIKDGPWNYGDAIMITKSPKYNERDHIKESQAFKNIWIEDPEIKSIVEGIF